MLVAGIGNLFLGDDGFGPEVVRHLAAGPPLPEGVRLVDYGIRGMHLLYDLLDGYQALVISTRSPAAAGPARWSCWRWVRPTWSGSAGTSTRTG